MHNKLFFIVITERFRVLLFKSYRLYVGIRVRPGFFDQVGHQTTNASIGNKHIFEIFDQISKPPPKLHLVTLCPA